MAEKYKAFSDKYGIFLDVIFIIVLLELAALAYQAENTLFPIISGLVICIYLTDFIKRCIKYFKK